MMGRPKKELNKEEFEKLCGMMCTKLEICGFLGLSDKTLDRLIKEEYNCTFSEAYKVFSAGGRASLRRTQWTLAEKNVAMAIFLGKNYLGQSDNPPPKADEEPDEAEIDGLSRALSDLAKKL